MIEWSAARLARAGGARLLNDDPGVGPARVMIDSRQVRPGDLFVGLPGEREDGGAYAAQALRAGAWGILAAPAHAEPLAAAVGAVPAGRDPQAATGGVILAHPDPLAAMQALATAWRRELGARVVAITGSTGKTSTKDILAAILNRELRTVASRQNFNTEIGLPLTVLSAPPGTQALVLELAMRGPGQIAQLTEICEPDVGVIVNIGPVHLQQLGSLQAVAAAKAELVAGMRSGSTVVLPHDEPLLDPHRRADLRTVSFGEHGDVRLLERTPSGEVSIAAGAQRLVLKPSFAQSHNLRNLLAAVAAAQALGVTPEGELDVTFSALRGERHRLPEEIVLIDDCYNANPMSMRAALEDLAATAPARRVAVLGDMLELGEEASRFHREVGAFAHKCGVELLLTVGPLAAQMCGDFDGFAGECHCVADAREAVELLPRLLHARDTVLVKGSRGVGLELLGQSLGLGRTLEQGQTLGGPPAHVGG